VAALIFKKQRHKNSEQEHAYTVANRVDEEGGAIVDRVQGESALLLTI
jgi:hypothetical protein